MLKVEGTLGVFIFIFFKKTVDIDKIFYYTTFVKFEIWSHGQEVKTSPFHGGNRGSSPLGTTKKTHPLGCFFVFKGTVCSAHKQLALFEPLLHSWCTTPVGARPQQVALGFG